MKEDLEQNTTDTIVGALPQGHPGLCGTPVGPGKETHGTPVPEQGRPWVGPQQLPRQRQRQTTTTGLRRMCFQETSAHRHLYTYTLTSSLFRFFAFSLFLLLLLTFTFSFVVFLIQLHLLCSIFHLKGRNGTTTQKKGGEKPPPLQRVEGGTCEQNTHSYSMHRCAQCVSTSHCTVWSQFHHANTRGSSLRVCVPKTVCHPRVMSRSLPHLALTTSTSSPIFPTVSPTHTRSMVLDPHLPCDVPRQSGGSTRIPSLTGYEPKPVEFKDIETEAIEPEDFEPRRIELDRNLGTDPYQIQERFMRNSLNEDMDEFGKVGAEVFYNQSLIHSDYDSAESIADSDLEDGELRKMLASPLFFQEREGNFDSSRKPRVSGKLDAMVVQERSKCTTDTRWSLKTRELDVKFISRARVSGKLDARFSFDSEPTLNTFLTRNQGNELGDQFESSVRSVFRFADPSNVGGSLLEGDKDHLLNQARFELLKQEHQVWSLNSCIDELQKQAYAQRLEFEDAHHGYIESRREQLRLQEVWSLKEKALRGTPRLNIHEMGEQKLRAKKKTQDNTKAHFTNAGNARANDFYDWFRWISRSWIGSPWEIVLRSQSTSSDSKFLFHNEPRQTLTWTHGRLDYRKTFLVINFLQLIHPEIIIKEFIILWHQVIQDRFQCVLVQELLSQEMKIKKGAQSRLQQEVALKEKALRDNQIRSMHEMGEKKRAQELRVGDFSVQKLRESQDTIQRLTFTSTRFTRKDEFFERFRDFQEVESNHSGRLSYVPSQPAMLPSYRSILSRDKRLPLGTWNASGPKENVFRNQFSTCDSSQNHCQAIHHTRCYRIDSSAYWYRNSCRKRWRSNQGHTSNADICRKAVDYVFYNTRGVSEEFYGWTAKTANIGTAIRQNALIHNHFWCGKCDSNIKWLLLLIFHRKQCCGSKKWRWLIRWTN